MDQWRIARSERPDDAGLRTQRAAVPSATVPTRLLPRIEQNLADRPRGAPALHLTGSRLASSSTGLQRPDPPAEVNGSRAVGLDRSGPAQDLEDWRPTLPTDDLRHALQPAEGTLSPLPIRIDRDLPVCVKRGLDMSTRQTAADRMSVPSDCGDEGASEAGRPCNGRPPRVSIPIRDLARSWSEAGMAAGRMQHEINTELQSSGLAKPGGDRMARHVSALLSLLSLRVAAREDEAEPTAQSFDGSGRDNVIEWKSGLAISLRALSGRSRSGFAEPRNAVPVLADYIMAFGSLISRPGRAYSAAAKAATDAVPAAPSRKVL